MADSGPAVGYHLDQMTPRKEKIMPPKTSLGEEIGNSVTHGVGALLSIAGTVLLIVRAAMVGTTIHVVSFAIYGLTLDIHTLHADSPLGSVGIVPDDCHLDVGHSRYRLQESVHRPIT